MDYLKEFEEIGASIEEIQNLLYKNESSQKKNPNTIENSKETFVRVTDDLREGWLYLAKPKDGEVYTQEGIIALLAENGVKKGLIMSNIAAMVKKGVYERSIKVALYQDCVEGQSGYYQYYFDIDAINTKNPKIRPDGSVDYTSLNILIGVTKDDKICTYHPAVPGTEGYFVDGSAIAPQKVADLPKLKGTGFRYDEETGDYYATVTGKIDCKNENEIHIRNVYQIKGDITQLNNRIEFNGDIEIDGNVESGSLIRCTHSVVISGVVEAAEIYAGGDVVLKRGIQGSNKAKIISNGNVYADFIEHAMVKAKGCVKSNTILNSEVLSDDKVILTGKRGTLVGGYTHGRKGISCINLGNDVEVKTVAHVGLETKDYLKNQDVMKKDTFLREQLEEILEKMNYTLKQKAIRPLTKKDLEQLNDLNNLKTQYIEDLKNNRNEQEIIGRIIEEAKDAQIIVEEHVYRGAIVAIDTYRMPIQASTQFMKYSNIGGGIEGEVLVVN